ncbi:MAG: dihydrolipoyl dehydrogenase [Candidatus Izemoplasmatales bacterium]|jgi:dihydrolipoamide dehydrogenase|nr:dihydrolipoyl dehydrogenase [Candidatus Izemoplasmatales bacterium]
MKNYDVIIIGSGPGGYVAAIKAGQKNLKVAIIEKEAIGGVCLNWGCIPTKALLKSAKVYTEILNAKEYGIDIDSYENIKPNWTSIVKRKDRIVKRLTGGVKMLLEKNNVDIYNGEGEILNKNEVKVNDEILKTKNIILATGSSPIIPPIPGINEAHKSGFLMTSKEMLSIDQIPKKLIIVGGGVIGIEFATIFNSFNTEVTIIEREKEILTNIDDDIREAMLKILKKAKIEILTEATVTGINDKKVIYKTDSGEEKTVNADRVLLSVGMKSNNESFKNLNLKMEKNFVFVNDQMQTSIPNVYAIGDVNGKMMLAHVASHQGLIAIEHIQGKTEKINYDQIPSVIYSFPEVAQIGLTEKIAKTNGIDYLVSKFPLQANGKALSANEKDGFIKIIASKPYNEIIGVHILADNASDLISEALMTMKLEGTANEIASSIHPHPTISEIYNEAALGIIEKPIHI